MKPSLLCRKMYLYRNLIASPTRFPLAYQSPISAILPCQYEPIVMLRKSRRMRSWTDSAANGATDLARFLRQLTIYLLLSKSSSPQRNQELLGWKYVNANVC